MLKQNPVGHIWLGAIAAFGLVMLVSYQNCGVRMVDTVSQNSSNSVELIAKVDLANSGGANTSVSGSSFNARVISTGLGGNCQYVIINSTGERFEPAGMDRALLIEGNLLYVHGFLRTDLVSMCQAGKILQIERVEPIATSTPGT